MYRLTDREIVFGSRFDIEKMDVHLDEHRMVLSVLLDLNSGDLAAAVQALGPVINPATLSPYHASFTEFYLDRSRSQEFFADGEQVVSGLIVEFFKLPKMM